MCVAGEALTFQTLVPEAGVLDRMHAGQCSVAKGGRGSLCCGFRGFCGQVLRPWSRPTTRARRGASAGTSPGRVPGAHGSQARGQSAEPALRRLSCGRPTCQVLLPSGFCAVTLTPIVSCPVWLAPGCQPGPRSGTAGSGPGGPSTTVMVRAPGAVSCFWRGLFVARSLFYRGDVLPGVTSVLVGLVPP